MGLSSRGFPARPTQRSVGTIGCDFRRPEVATIEARLRVDDDVWRYYNACSLGSIRDVLIIRQRVPWLRMAGPVGRLP